MSLRLAFNARVAKGAFSEEVAQRLTDTQWLEANGDVASCGKGQEYAESFASFSHWRKRISLLGPAILSFNGNLKTLGNTFPVEGLRQVANRPGRERLRTNLLIGVRRKKNERQAGPLRPQVGLQLNPAHAGHLNISDHTRETIDAVRVQEFLGGSERVCNITERPHQTVGRDADRFIIVNDCD